MAAASNKNAGIGASIRNAVRERPFSSVLGLWGSILAGTGVYLYKREIPTQLKVIQARIVAQAGLIGLVCGIGLVTVLTADGEPHEPVRSTWKLRDFTEKPHEVEVREVAGHSTAAAAAAAAPGSQLK